MVRDFIRHIQNIRKESEFDVLDRVVVYCHSSDELKEALTKHLDYIKKEVLADKLEFDGQKKKMQEFITQSTSSSTKLPDLTEEE